jgi:small subunit ribosomal protein S18
VCVFCTEHIAWVDYKDMNLLRRFMSDRGKIKSRANTGTCSQHQSDVALAIKNARELALLPYAVRTLAGDKSTGRRGRGGPGGSGRPGERPTGPPPGAPSTAGVDAAASDDLVSAPEASAPEASAPDELASVATATEVAADPTGDSVGDVDTASNEEVQS